MKNLKPAILEALSYIGKLLGCLFLIVLALLLLVVVLLPAIIWKVVLSIKSENRKARDIASGTSQFFKAIAISLDQLGNVAFGGFFSWMFILNPLEYAFGRTNETVSEVLGWNQALDNLSRVGRFMVAILDFIETDHCLKAMSIGIFDAKFKTNFYHDLKRNQEIKKSTQEFISKYK